MQYLAEQKYILESPVPTRVPRYAKYSGLLLPHVIIDAYAVKPKLVITAAERQGQVWTLTRSCIRTFRNCPRAARASDRDTARVCPHTPQNPTAQDADPDASQKHIQPVSHICM